MNDTLEPVETAATASTPTPDGRFTTDNAREMSARGKEALRRKREQRQLSAIKAEMDQRPTDVAPTSSEFVLRRLARVRALLDDIDDQLAKARDPLDRERLARAANVLSEQERILDGRPLPGARKPGPVKQLRDVPLAPIG